MGILDGWRYCPRDRAELEPRDGSLHCPHCDSTYYANSAPAAEGLLERDGKVLLAKRAREPRRGCWDVPGGFLEEGEDAIDGLKREYREETGIDVEPVEFLGPHLERYDDYYVLGLTWLVRGDGDPQPSDDAEELRWFAPDELPGEMAFPHQDALLADWASRQQHA